MLRLNSLKFKISVLALLILAGILVIYSAFLFLTFRHTLYQELDNTLVAKVQKIDSAVTSYLDVLGYDPRSFQFSISRVITQTGEHPHKNKIERLEKLWLGQATPFGIRSDYVEFRDSAGNVLAHSGNIYAPISPVTARDLRAAFAGHPVFKDAVLGKEDLRLIVERVRYDKLGKNSQYVIVIATSRERVARLLKERLISKAVSITIILLIAAFLSHLFASSVLKPIKKITDTARNINYKDLSVRIDPKDMDVEVRDLVNALNEMMSRLERSFQYIAEFSGHVSHELKTPLAILRGESELALRSEHTAEEYRRVIQDNLEEVTRMTKIVEDLLLLTKLDYQQQVFKMEELDLTAFFRELEESTRILADEKEITVETDIPQESLKILGDKTHLRRLFFNLINNALKFTYPGGKISIGMRREGSQAILKFKDTGIGIPEENIQKVFDKFFHFNATGLDVPAGNGLGLSMAKAIVKVHGGDIAVESRVGQGTLFTVRIPLV